MGVAQCYCADQRRRIYTILVYFCLLDLDEKRRKADFDDQPN